MNFHILSLNFQFIFLNKVYMNNQRIETSCQSIRIFNVQLTSTLFARQETQIIRQLFSRIRKLTNYIFIDSAINWNCTKTI